MSDIQVFGVVIFLIGLAVVCFRRALADAPPNNWTYFWPQSNPTALRIRSIFAAILGLAIMSLGVFIVFR